MKEERKYESLTDNACQRIKSLGPAISCSITSNASSSLVRAVWRSLYSGPSGSANGPSTDSDGCGRDLDAKISATALVFEDMVAASSSREELMVAIATP